MPSLDVEPVDVGLIQQVQQLWNSGNPTGAVDLLRPRAAEGAPWAAAMFAWLRMQQGIEGYPESIDFSIRAAELGAPWQVANTFNNVMANLPSAPHLAERIPELVQWAAPWVGGIDLVGQAWNLIAQGQPEAALKVMSVKTPWPLSDPQLASMVEQGYSRLSELDHSLAAARETRASFDESVASSAAAIAKAENDLTTSAKQAGLLVTTVLSDATNALYIEDASRNEKQSKGAWIAGLVVLGVAALAAVLPLALHYLGRGPDYATIEVIGVHLASTAALGTFAGVLLARARSRDHAAQRAYDLSTAMGTMISYSNQISNPVEKERFMMTMGQVVMQAHLSSGAGGKVAEDPMPGVLALVSALKASNPPGVSASS
ncbi:hypothetical protein [Clavibacter michiganensis]|uniref:hypothetical protein n=1 Tax=Clavibacter michiganensis TaxID=28447 RepID=UPI003EBA034A